MKSIIIAALGAAGVAMAGPAFAQSTTPLQPYVTLGYTYLNPYDRDLGEVTGRMGLRLWRFIGVEGEIGGGVLDNSYTNSTGAHVKLSEGTQATGYLVGFFPVWGDKIDLLARVGYGETPLILQTPTQKSIETTHPINLGAGAQYALNNKDGLRFDYTWRDFQGGYYAPHNDNTYAVSFVHKF
jgi:opacity protein-like surface antigen